MQLHKAEKGGKRRAKGIQCFPISPYEKKAEKGEKRRLTQLFLSFMIFFCLYSTYENVLLFTFFVLIVLRLFYLNELILLSITYFSSPK